MIQKLAAVVLLFGTAILAHDPLVVETSAGKVRGYMMTSNSGRQFLAFAKVPYAKPPLGPLRFQPPQELERWQGVKNSSEPGPYCMQYGVFGQDPPVFGSEDCLYLSLYTHSTRGREAVIVHFHAGGFHVGNGARWTQPHYMMDQDVVIVDVNYRLAYLGFLSFENKEMPGNQGLKDQVMALKWVKKNIAKFGGDPNKVTIMGESAGGCSVHHHTVSLQSRGLFHRGIAESGTSYIPFAIAPPGYAKSEAQLLARNLGCPVSSTSAAVSCLRSKNASDIAERVIDLKGWRIDSNMIWPSLEPEGIDAFLTAPISKWQHQPVPLLLGATSGEGLLRTEDFAENPSTIKYFSDNFDTLAPLSLMYNASASDPAAVTRKVREYYFQGGEITSESWVNLTQMFSDSWFYVGIIDGANLHTGPAYFYLFDYVGEYTYKKDVNRTLFFGAPHIAEMEFLWKVTWINGSLRGDDLNLSRKLVKLWTNFAKYGNPTPRGSGMSWRKWNPKDHNYLLISNSGFAQKNGFAMDSYRFWKSTGYRDNLK